MEIRRPTQADAATLQRLWEQFTAEATFTPYPGSPFEPGFVTDHRALVAEGEGEAVGTVYANTASPTSATCLAGTLGRVHVDAVSPER